MDATPIPTRGALALTDAARRRSASTRAKPDCPLCGGKGRTIRRIEIPFIGGVEAVPCKCTEGARHV